MPVKNMKVANIQRVTENHLEIELFYTGREGEEGGGEQIKTTNLRKR